MNKKELFDVFNGFSGNLIDTLSQLDNLKKEVQQVIEENARLRIENSQLRELLAQTVTPKKHDKPNHQAKDHLESIYEEGFHICNSFYGQQRDGGECFFCLELLDRKN